MIKVWDLNSKWPRNTDKKLLGHNSVTCLEKINANQIASGSQDNSIKIWNLDQEQCVRTLKGASKISSLIKLNKEQISSGNENSITIWNIINGNSNLVINTDFTFLFLKLNANQMSSFNKQNKMKIWLLKNEKCEDTLDLGIKINYYEQCNILKLNENEIITSKF